jgi:hypothetical protein
MLRILGFSAPRGLKVIAQFLYDLDRGAAAAFDLAAARVHAFPPSQGGVMSTIRLLSFALLALHGLAAAAATHVAFVEPQNYRDAGLDRDYRVQADDPALREIATCLRKLGDRYLGAADSLEVEVLDVDLAGRFEPWHPQLYGVRIMDSITWPAITVRYTLTRDGRTGTAVEERIVDPLYLTRQKTWFPGERMGYEKRMLDEWFRARFAQATPPR